VSNAKHVHELGFRRAVYTAYLGSLHRPPEEHTHFEEGLLRSHEEVEDFRENMIEL
jgi:hypothetical protein